MNHGHRRRGSSNDTENIFNNVTALNYPNLERLSFGYIGF
jgi:hypothetical protein